MSLEKVVIDNIKRIRKEKGMSQEKLAEACNTTTSYIGLMEIYKNVPKLSTIERIAVALNIDPIILFQPPTKSSAQKEETMERIKSSLMHAIETELVQILGTHLQDKSIY
jgi:transcriptional regulator with XRE-family HTH domain